MAFAGPGSIAFNQTIVRWALEHYLGVIDRDPEPLPYDDARAREVVGTYENEMMTVTIGVDRAELTVECEIRPEIRAAAKAALPPNLPPAGLGLLPGNADDYIITSGGLKGQRGFFSRDANGAVVGVDLAGRLFNRVLTSSE